MKTQPPTLCVGGPARPHCASITEVTIYKLKASGQNWVVLSEGHPTPLPTRATKRTPADRLRWQTGVKLGLYKAHWRYSEVMCPNQGLWRSMSTRQRHPGSGLSAAHDQGRRLTCGACAMFNHPLHPFSCLCIVCASCAIPLCPAWGSRRTFRPWAPPYASTQLALEASMMWHS